MDSTNSHRLDGEGSAAKAEHNLLGYLAQIRKETIAPLGEWVEHFEKITQSFLPKLFSYLQQPLLPLTNNELEIFIGQHTELFSPLLSNYTV